MIRERVYVQVNEVNGDGMEVDGEGGGGGGEEGEEKKITWGNGSRGGIEVVQVDKEKLKKGNTI